MKEQENKGRATHEVDVEDFNPKPIPEGEIEQMLANAPEHIKARAAEWAEQRKNQKPVA